jgi:hypothetical protein
MPDDPQLCANPDCRQPLLLVREERELCARCEKAAGVDSWQWVTPGLAGGPEAFALGIETVSPDARAVAQRLAADSGQSRWTATPTEEG